MFSSGVAAIFQNLAKALFILTVLFFLNTKLALMTLAFLPPPAHRQYSHRRDTAPDRPRYMLRSCR